MHSLFSAAAKGLVWREWDGEFVVHDCRHARTHLLGFGAGEVLLALLRADTGLSIDQLSRRLFSDDAGHDDQNNLSKAEHAALEELVMTLVGLALVDVRPC